MCQASTSVQLFLGSADYLAAAAIVVAAKLRVLLLLLLLTRFARSSEKVSAKKEHFPRRFSGKMSAVLLRPSTYFVMVVSRFLASFSFAPSTRFPPSFQMTHFPLPANLFEVL